MNDSMLRELDITNFRSIRGHIHAPLDAKVVLVHGENGAGKTSFLSAIELALTGGVQSLKRADTGYAKQLLHRSADRGSVLLNAAIGADQRNFEAKLSADGARTIGELDARLSSFFSERAYLPQSLLGQLLQIYQESGSDKDSPLAKFVGKLLGLDRLDALESGLQPLADVRNVRKITKGWSAADTQKTRIERLLEGQTKTRKATAERIDADIKRLAALCIGLELGVVVDEIRLDAAKEALNDPSDTEALEARTDQLRQLGSIGREIQDAQRGDNGQRFPDAASTAADYAAWDSAHGATYAALRARVEALLPEVSLPSEMSLFAGETAARLSGMATELSHRAEQARRDGVRLATAYLERKQAAAQRDAIDAEVAALPADAGSLASALSELTSFIDTEICPVCDRNFAEMDQGSLSDHVQAKVRSLSGSAGRLLSLGRSRGEAQIAIERLDGEIETLSARTVDPQMLAELDRDAAAAGNAASQVEAMAATLDEGAQLLALDVSARRAISDAQSRNATLLAARETLRTFSLSVGAPEVGETEQVVDASARLQLHLMAETKRLGERLTNRRQGLELVASIRTVIERRTEMDASIENDAVALSEVDAALARAQELREQGQAIRRAVDKVRSSIIRREFNERLNRLWRDLFVRLAPAEPFVPAFRIPPSATQRLQPKLITEHRLGGDAGGTPGAMLSAGNLNTAALTLFIALHLSVPKELPWLILDDPVQSMDDVHIAHFAALLRTLSKQHDRQIVIAVHDRQLFEYLRLELSPSTPADSLITLELSRGPRRDTLCMHERLSYREETALLAAA